MEKAAFYTGPGVFNFEDEDYGYGEKLPSGLPAATVGSMIEKGKASYTAPSTAQAASSDNAAAELQAELAKAGKHIAELQAELDAAQETIKTQKGTIEALTAQITNPTAPPNPAAPAGPKK